MLQPLLTSSLLRRAFMHADRVAGKGRLHFDVQPLACHANFQTEINNKTD